MTPLAFTPVIIIGAGRSGTNVLRDTLTLLPDFSTWDCDEINPIWRHGNLTWPNDEIPANRAGQSVVRFIRQAFQKLWRQSGKPRFVVEKTCANSLRVEFVDAILPEAKFIYIVRDGFDVVASAGKRWQGDLELPAWPYYWAKIRYTPLLDLPLYGLIFARNKLALLFGRKKRLSAWGPRFDGMESHSNAPLEELCARQWAACVNASDAAFSTIDPKRVFMLRYEDFTAEPDVHLSAVLGFLGASKDQEIIKQAASTVHKSSVGKGRVLLTTLPKDVIKLMKKPLSAHRYRD
jgi:sulfotransferase family protein